MTKLAIDEYDFGDDPLEDRNKEDSVGKNSDKQEDSIHDNNSEDDER